jgi:hypothetical protein
MHTVVDRLSKKIRDPGQLMARENGTANCCLQEMSKVAAASGISKRDLMVLVPEAAGQGVVVELAPPRVLNYVLTRVAVMAETVKNG